MFRSVLSPEITKGGISGVFPDSSEEKQTALLHEHQGREWLRGSSLRSGSIPASPSIAAIIRVCVASR